MNNFNEISLNYQPHHTAFSKLDRNSYLLTAIQKLDKKHVNWNVDAISQGQLESKKWLVNELEKINLDLGIVFLCAGWYGILSILLLESSIKIDKIRSFDIDKTVAPIADIFNHPWVCNDWRFKAIIEDIHNIDFNSHSWSTWSNANQRKSKSIVDSPDTIINTSCEHIENFNEWFEKIPTGKLMVLQSNNFIDVKEHINISSNLNEFTKQTPMTNILYEGELPMHRYTRFMRIGIK